MSIRSTLRSRLGRNKVERGTLVVSRNSWHGRLYHFWRENSEYKNSDRYRENLCHYVRVVLFWAPIAAFLHSKPRVLGGLRPAVVTGALVALGGVVAAFVLNPGGSLLVTLYSLAIAAALVGVFFLAYQLEENKYEIRAWWRNGGRGVRPIKIFGRVVSAPLRAVGWVLESVYDALTPLGRRISRALSREVISDIPLGAVLAVLAVITGVALGTIFGDIVVLLVALTVLGAAILLVVILFAADVLRDWLMDRSLGRPVGRKETRDEGLLKVGARFAVAKKGKICPFIEVQ